tara:strand:- start:5022 stop:5168 length:147 start_codon:yes stop_codon:yes gene_type:complete
MNKTEQFKIQTPIGSVESDSGNHLVDVISVLFVIAIVFIFKKAWKSIK